MSDYFLWVIMLPTMIAKMNAVEDNTCAPVGPSIKSNMHYGRWKNHHHRWKKERQSTSHHQTSIPSTEIQITKKMVWQLPEKKHRWYLSPPSDVYKSLSTDGVALAWKYYSKKKCSIFTFLWDYFLCINIVVGICMREQI